MAEEPLKIGSFTIIDELSSGAQGRTYLARRTLPSGHIQPAVLKVPLPSVLVEEANLHRFLGEIHVSLQANHSNIVKVFDVGIHEGLIFLVLEYVPGKDLADMCEKMRIQRTIWPAEIAAHVVREIGYALHHAHNRKISGVPHQIVHRDVKPSNVMVSEEGEVKLLDLGIAKIRTWITQEFAVRGTLRYMAPEQLLGEVGPSVDAWGLGAILWELLAGTLFRWDVPEKQFEESVLRGYVGSLERHDLPACVLEALWGLLNADPAKRMTVRTALDLLERKEIGIHTTALALMMKRVYGEQPFPTGHTSAHAAAPASARKLLKAGKSSVVEEVLRQRAEDAARAQTPFPMESLSETRAESMRAAVRRDVAPLPNSAAHSASVAEQLESHTKAPTVLLPNPQQDESEIQADPTDHLNLRPNWAGDNNQVPVRESRGNTVVQVGGPPSVVGNADGGTPAPPSSVTAVLPAPTGAVQPHRIDYSAWEPEADAVQPRLPSRTVRSDTYSPDRTMDGFAATETRSKPSSRMLLGIFAAAIALAAGTATAMLIAWEPDEPADAEQLAPEVARKTAELPTSATPKPTETESPAPAQQTSAPVVPAQAQPIVTPAEPAPTAAPHPEPTESPAADEPAAKVPTAEVPPPAPKPAAKPVPRGEVRLRWGFIPDTAQLRVGGKVYSKKEGRDQTVTLPVGRASLSWRLDSKSTWTKAGRISIVEPGPTIIVLHSNGPVVTPPPKGGSK